MTQLKATLGQGGRIVIPSEYRRALGVRPGDDLILVLENRTVLVMTPRDAVKRAQELVHRYAKGRQLSAELRAERRAEDE